MVVSDVLRREAGQSWLFDAGVGLHTLSPVRSAWAVSTIHVLGSLVRWGPFVATFARGLWTLVS